MPSYSSDEILFLTEPKVDVFPFPYDVPSLAGKFLIFGIGMVIAEGLPQYFYLYPSGLWRKGAKEDGFSAYYDTSTSAKQMLLRTRINRHSLWEKQVEDELGLIKKFYN